MKCDKIMICVCCSFHLLYMWDALTLWGIITDTSYTDDDKRYYDSLILSDSDNQRPVSETHRRSMMMNSLDVYKLKPYKNDEIAYDTFILYEERGLASSFSALCPYTDDSARASQGSGSAGQDDQAIR